MLGDLVIHYDQRRVTVAGRPVELTATEFELLRALSINGGAGIDLSGPAAPGLGRPGLRRHRPGARLHQEAPPQAGRRPEGAGLHLQPARRRLPLGPAGQDLDALPLQIEAAGDAQPAPGRAHAADSWSLPNLLGGPGIPAQDTVKRSPSGSHGPNIRPNLQGHPRRQQDTRVTRTSFRQNIGDSPRRIAAGHPSFSRVLRPRASIQRASDRRSASLVSSPSLPLKRMLATQHAAISSGCSDRRLPSFVRGWRAARNYYFTFGLEDGALVDSYHGEKLHQPSRNM